MISELKINKPDPIVSEKELLLFQKATDIKQTIKVLESGEAVLVVEFYSNGLFLLKELQKYLNLKFPNQSFLEQRKYRDTYRKLSNLILIEIEDHKLNLKKAPSVGWLQRFYPKTASFLLTFPQVQGLNSAWEWYQNGISIPVLRNKIHPYYGTYFPTRFDHLILFDNWLKRFEGTKKNAIEVGVGSGVLSFQMIKHGFQKIFATDNNPNAIFGLKEFMGNTKLSRKIELDLGHLFGKWKAPVELIVFNPPWLPETDKSESLDEAIYYNDKLFPDFFIEAKKRLLIEGKLLIIFSNLAQITNVTQAHPVKYELENGGRFELEKCFKKTVKLASDNTKRNQAWRATEEVELWVLIHKAD